MGGGAIKSIVPANQSDLVLLVAVGNYRLGL
jgi:hypothetical protein